MNAESSDDRRTAAPLPHAEYVTFGEPLALESGEILKGLRVCYETYGSLNEGKDNAVLVCHALSGDSHVARHDPEDSPGWWDIAVGPGGPIDTNRFFVICPNILGGCRGSTGPNSIDPERGKPYGQDFPSITIFDMIEAQRRLVDHLGIDRLKAVIGGSMGGQMVLAWALRHPKRIENAVAIATAARLSSQSLAFDIVGRNAIVHDPNFRSGRYYGETSGPDVGLAIARMIGHITYLSRESMREKFEADRRSPRDIRTAFEKEFSVGSYLGYQGDRFVERFDANSYVVLTKAMDGFDLEEDYRGLHSAFDGCRWLVISYSSDWLFPPEQSQAIVNSLIAANREVSYCNVTSPCGHDAFLLPHDLEIYGALIRGFLQNDGTDPAAAPPRASGGNPHADNGPSLAQGESPPEGKGAQAADSAAGSDSERSAGLSIFGSRRLDYDRILRLIPAKASVLDLGCGRGELLTRLRAEGHGRILGVELDERAIVSCARRGIPVIHADLNRRLPQFPDKSFDCVVLSQTLQAVIDVQGLLAEIVRIGGRGIVSFPNFAYRKLRTMLYEEGRAPESPGILRHRWYNTPNLRFFSIRDFEELCAERSIRIHRRIALNTEAGREVVEEPNRSADMAIYVINGA